MNRKHHFTRAAMMLLLSVLTAATAWAQSSTVYIPSEELASYGSSSHPSSPYYSYSLTQQIYTAAEIGQAGKITSIAFYNRDPGSPREYDIYLTLTNKEYFSNKYDWTAVKADEKVFSGTVTLAKNKWTVIDFDKPFEYDGTSNLILTVDDNTDNEGAQYGNTMWCTAFSASDQSLGIDNNYVTNVNFDPMNPPTEDIKVVVDGETETLKPGIYYRKNQIQLGFETYVKPYQLTVADVTNVSTLVSWTARGSESEWNLRYKETAATDWTEVNSITTRSHPLQELNSGTKYEVQVQSVIGSNKSDWTASVPFTTLSCDAANTTEVIYALMDRNNNGWGDQAIRVKEHKTGLEVAYLTIPKGKLEGGYLTLCCSKDYDLEWIRDDNDYAGYYECAFTFYYANGDEIIRVTYDDYNELRESHLLTTFTADCTDYAFAMPTDVEVYDETYQGVTLSWKSKDASLWQVSYSTDPDFDPEKGTLVDVDACPFDLTGLAANTTYYFAIRSVDEVEAAARDMGNGQLKAKKWKKKSRWSKKAKFMTKKEKARARKLKKAKILRRDQAKALLNKYVGIETKDNLLYSKLSTKRKPVDMEQVVVRQLEEDKGNIQKGSSYIYSECYDGSSFDNAVLIPAKKGSQLVAKVEQMKTGHGKTEPYETGWIPKKAFSGDPANKEEVSDNTMKNLLEINRRYKIEAYSTSNEEADAMEANDDTEEKAAEARSWSPRQETEEENDGYLFIRHRETSGGILSLSEMEIVEPEDVEPWTKVPLGEGVMEHVIENLVPETTYLAKVEPVYSDESTGLMSPITVFTPHDAIYLFDDEDNSATIAENDGQTVDVVLSDRTFYMDGRWNTFCAPFNMTDEQFKEALPAYYQYRDIIFMVMHDAVLESGVLKVTFYQVHNVQAGKAYIFRFDGDGYDENIHSPLFPSVTIKKAAPAPYTDVNNMITFCGTYAPFALTAGNQQQLYLKSDLLWYPTADINVNAFRGYFELLAPLSAREFKLVFEDGTTTVINPDATDWQRPADGNIYSIDGRKLNSAPTKKGIYIMNGKKVVIK